MDILGVFGSIFGVVSRGWWPRVTSPAWKPTWLILGFKSSRAEIKKLLHAMKDISMTESVGSVFNVVFFTIGEIIKQLPMHEYRSWAVDGIGWNQSRRLVDLYARAPPLPD